MNERPRRATLADVAARASVDRSVVSRVLSGDSSLNIRNSTRERVLQAVADLEYRPNATARSLRQGRTGILGLLIPDFMNPVYPAIVKGAESAAGELGAGLLVASSCDGGFGGRRYAELVTQGRIDGLVLAGQSETDEVSASLLRSGVPWLMLNLCSNDTHRCVVLDDQRAAILAVNHLLEQGHTRIAHLGGPPTVASASRRRAGYEAALREARVDATGDTTTAEYTEEAGARATELLLAAKDRPTAIFAANMFQAIGALRATRLAEVSVPRDLSIVAVHDLRPAAFLDPALTTVRMPLEELGSRAVQLLEQSSPDEHFQEVVAEPMELVVRDSTAPPPS
jgi:LacI family transcriptional regulator